MKFFINSFPELSEYVSKTETEFKARKMCNNFFKRSPQFFTGLASGWPCLAVLRRLHSHITSLIYGLPDRSLVQSDMDRIVTT
jgi:hypothetical protein